MIRPKVLVVEDDQRILRELIEDRSLSSSKRKESRDYVVLVIPDMEIHLTGELGMAMGLVKEYVFDAYFLDNEIFNREINKKSLSQDELISVIVKTDPLSIPRADVACHPIYNISSHFCYKQDRETEHVLRYISGTCKKSGTDILRMIRNLCRQRD